MRDATLVALLAASTAAAHVGSPDIFHEGAAGPYPLFVTIRPPVVIPGVAEVEIRTSAPDVRKVLIVPTPLTGPGAKLPPAPDVAERSKSDGQFFTGSLWIMQTGSWQVRVTMEGERGGGQLAVPVTAVAQRTAGMETALGSVLFVLMLILGLGAVSIVSAGVAESQLEPGVAPNPVDRRRGRIAMLATATFVALILWGGNKWWKAEASNYARYVYKPLEMNAELHGGRLLLRLRDPGWLAARSMDDFIPDHGHPMHLFVVRLPEMERVWHLHPDMAETGLFAHDLPPIPAGRYALYADVVHKGGFPETMVTEIELPDVSGSPLKGDDTTGTAPPLSSFDPSRTVTNLSGGYRAVWVRDKEPLGARAATRFTFRVEDAQGRPAEDLELYMGMQGHAAFFKTDRSVFAHVHPSGTTPMAALALTESETAQADPHAGHTKAKLPAEVSFPYGIPQPGDYRLFVQIKRAGKVETAGFDLRVEN